MNSFWHRTLRTVGRALGRPGVDDHHKGSRNGSSRPHPRNSQDHQHGADPRPDGDRTAVYDVSRRGLPPLQYAPQPDDLPDPGDLVWTWVPYEEDANQGKDRPVLVLARTGRSAVVLQLTSKDHDRDAEQEARYGRHWMDIGSGDWDSQQRASEVRIDRLLVVPIAAVRRTGGTLDKERYESVAEALRQYHL